MEVKEVLIFAVLVIGVPVALWIFLGPVTFFEKLVMLIVSVIVAIIMFIVSMVICAKCK